MTTPIKSALALGLMLAGGALLPALADQPITRPADPAGITLFSAPGEGGRSLHVNREVPVLASRGFDNAAQSMTITGGRWEICDGNKFRDDCEVFGPGKYELRNRGWAGKIGSIRPLESGTPTITLFWGANYAGEAHTYATQSRGMKYFGTNEKAVSVKVRGGLWKLCEDSYLTGRCELVDQDIPDLGAWHFARDIASVGKGKESYGYSGDNGQIIFYDGPNQQGIHVSIGSDVYDLNSAGFSDRTTSIRVQGGAWEVCDDIGYQGHCEVIRRNVRDLGHFGLNNRISSIRAYVPPENGGDGDGSGWNDGGYGNEPGWNNGGYRHGGNGWNDWNDGGNWEFGRSFAGQRTIFFPAPKMNGKPVAACLSPGFQCGKWAADEFCTVAGLGRSVYSDAIRAHGEVWYLDRDRLGMSNSNNNNRHNKRKLVDVLCKR